MKRSDILNIICIVAGLAAGGYFMWLYTADHYETKIIKNGHAKYNETTGDFKWSKCR